MRRLRDIRLSEKDRRAIEAAAHLLRDRFPVEQVALFGSKAHRADDEESDIDLLVLAGRKLGWREEDAITTALFDLEPAYDAVFSILIVPSQEWTTGTCQVLPIHDEITRDGLAAWPTGQPGAKPFGTGWSRPGMRSRRRVPSRRPGGSTSP